MIRLKFTFLLILVFFSGIAFTGHVCEDPSLVSVISDYKHLCIKPYFENEENIPVPGFVKSKNDLRKNLVLFGSSTSKDGIDYLYWAMCPEKENFFFEIQRLYKNKWEFVSGVGSQENTIEITCYDIPIIHQHGINKYRLKQIDKSGRFSFSETLDVDWTGEKLNISNHPLYSDPENKILVILDDNLGNTVAIKTQIKYENGSLIAMYKPHHISSGLYQIVGSSTNMFDGATLVIR